MKRGQRHGLVGRGRTSDATRTCETQSGPYMENGHAGRSRRSLIVGFFRGLGPFFEPPFLRLPPFLLLEESSLPSASALDLSSSAFTFAASAAASSAASMSWSVCSSVSGVSAVKAASVAAIRSESSSVGYWHLNMVHTRCVRVRQTLILTATNAILAQGRGSRRTQLEFCHPR